MNTGGSINNIRAQFLAMLSNFQFEEIVKRANPPGYWVERCQKYFCINSSLGMSVALGYCISKPHYLHVHLQIRVIVLPFNKQWNHITYLQSSILLIFLPQVNVSVHSPIITAPTCVLVSINGSSSFRLFRWFMIAWNDSSSERVLPSFWDELRNTEQ